MTSNGSADRNRGGAAARGALATLVALALPACGGGRPPAEPAAAPAILETVGDIAVVPLDAGGFDALLPAERAMAYYMVRAAIAGRDIEYRRDGDAALEIRDLLEEILTHPRLLEPAFRDGLLEYLKRFWIHGGNRDRSTGHRFVPGFSFEDLRAGARAAQADGAGIRLAIGEPLAAKLDRLRPAIFDAGADTGGPCRSRPGAGGAVTARGPGGIPVAGAPLAGGHAAERRTMRGFLAKAAAHAAGPQRGHLLRLGAWLTGDPAAGPAAPPGLAPLLDPRVDTIAMPVAACAAAHGRDGAWHGLVWTGDDGTTRRLAVLGAEMRDTVTIAATVLVGVGALGPMTPVSIMPDEPGAAGAGGRRCLILINVLEAGDRALLEPIVNEFAPPEDRALLLERGRDASLLLAALHAVPGHDGEPPAPARPDPPPDDLRGVLLEARADLRALRHLLEPRPADLAIPSPPRDAGAAVRLYLTRALALLRAASVDGILAGDEARAAHLVATWLLERGHGVEQVAIEGRAYWRLSGVAAARAGVDGLLEEVERLLGRGDDRAARALVERLGTRADPALRAEIAGRAGRAGVSSRLACMMPDLIPVRDAAGEVVDARAGPAADFTLQMLRYSGKLPFEAAAR